MRLALRLTLLTLLANALPAAAEPTPARLATLSDENASRAGPSSCRAAWLPSTSRATARSSPCSDSATGRAPSG